MDASGNGFFGDLEIVHCDGLTCSVGSALTEAEDLDTDLVDVSGDGVFRVITKETAGFRTRSTWGRPPFAYTIRSLIGGELVDVSAKYPDYFKEHIIPRMKIDRKAVEAESASSNRRLKLMTSVELQYVEDDYHRRILGERRAGLDNALKWARSADQGLREFGCQGAGTHRSLDCAAELVRIARSGAPGGPSRSSAADDARNALLRRTEETGSAAGERG